MDEAIADKVRDHIGRHLPEVLGEDVQVTEVEPAGHHVRAHTVARLRGPQGQFRLFMKMVTPHRKAALRHGVCHA